MGLPDDVPNPDPSKNRSASEAAAVAQSWKKDTTSSHNNYGNNNNMNSYNADDDLPVIEAQIPRAGTTATTKGKLGAASATNHHHHRTLVAESETVPPKVSWEPEQRTFQDKVWGILYVLAFAAFLGCGFTLVAKAQPRYDWHDVAAVGTTTGSDNNSITSVRVVSEYHQDKVRQCCASKPNGHDPDDYGWDLCSELTVDDATRRRLQMRFLQQSSTLDDSNGDDYNNNTYDGDDFWTRITTHSDSKFEPGDGMFDAFSQAPGIIITLCILALSLALIWVVLIRFFATPIVFATEILKVAFFVYLFVTGLMHRTTGAAVVALLCAMGIIAWDIYTLKQLQFAGKVLSYAALSFKDNTSMFCAFLPILALYAGNACLFVLFFAKSFDVVEVQQFNECYTVPASYYDGTPAETKCTSSCLYVSPSYTTGMALYISLAYLWSVLLFSTMRLSIIANVIGSWHFHPEHTPGIARAVINTCTTSMGTLSVASLIASAAEKLNRMLLAESMWKNCFNPIFWVIMPLYCCFGACIKMVILMLTKFSVILHVFTGKSWMGSAKKVFKILKRHFKNGFVTEYASQSVLSLGSYVFSIGIYFIAWVWLDREFHTETFIDVNDSTLMFVVWCFFALFNIWYPVLGLYLMILLNRELSKWEELDPAVWVTPFAATFVGCIAMMFFTYMAGIFLDTVDVLFLCFAIDRDNNVDMGDDEFAKLVTEGVPAYLETPDLDDLEMTDDHKDHEAPVPIVVVTGVEPVTSNNY